MIGPWNARRPVGASNDAAYKTAVLRALAQLAPGSTGQESFFRLDQFASTIEKSVWLFSAIYRVANAVASTRFRVLERDSNREAKGPKADALRKLMRSINPDDTSFDFKQAIFVHKNLDGEWFAQKARDGFGRVAQLWVLQPQFTRVIADPTGARRIGGFVHWGGGEDIKIPRSEMIYCRDYHPGNQYRGMSPTAPLKRELDWDLKAARFNISLIDEGMRLGGIVTPKEGYTLSEPDWELLKAALRINNQGARNAGRILALNQPFNFTPDGIVPADMEMIEGRKMIRDMAGSAIGAAPMQLMNYDAASYANSDAQIRQFWDHVGKPMLLQSFSAINEQLVEPDFSEDLELAPDMAGIDAQIDSEKTRVETTSRLLLSGITSLNEARERMGLDPVDGGEAHFVQGAIVPMKPGEFVNPLAQAGNNRPQDQNQSGAPANDAPQDPQQRQPPGQAPRSSSSNPGPAKALNGHALERFADATGVLARLQGDIGVWRVELSEGLDDPPTLMSFQTRKALVSAMEAMSGKSARASDPAVHRAIGQTEAELRNERDRYTLMAEAHKEETADIMRDEALDPFATALRVWTRITPILAGCAEDMA